MNKFKQILFTLIAVAGLSLAVSAQKGGDRPPKDPPKIPANPNKPPPPKNPPPKKPGMSFYVALPPEDQSAE